MKQMRQDTAKIHEMVSKITITDEAKKHEKALKEPKLFGRIGNEN